MILYAVIGYAVIALVAVLVKVRRRSAQAPSPVDVFSLTAHQRRPERIRVDWNWYSVSFRYTAQTGSLADLHERLRRDRRLWTVWFGLGRRLALLLMAVCFVGLWKNIVDALRSGADPPSTLVVPVVPGLTVPSWQAGYIWVAVAVAVIVHEFGHLLSAALYDIPVREVGLSVACLIPMAFVSVDSDVLASRPGWVRRDVSSAGILHNVALAAACSAGVAALPLVLYPFYEQTASPVVQECSSGSPLHPVITAGVSRLHALNGIALDGAGAFPFVLQTIAEGSRGICVSSEVVVGADDACCQSSSSDLCMVTADQGRFCIRSKSQLPSLRTACDPDNPCRLQDDDAVCSYAQDTDSHVVYLTTESSTLVFVGPPAELAATVTLCDYAGRAEYLPVGLPAMLERLLQMLVSVNVSLALVNAGPVFGFDGEHLVRTWASTPVRTRRIRGLLGLGTCLLAVNIVLALSIHSMRSISWR